MHRATAQPLPLRAPRVGWAPQEKPVGGWGPRPSAAFVHVGPGCAWLSPEEPGLVSPTTLRVWSELLVAGPALGGLFPLSLHKVGPPMAALCLFPAPPPPRHQPRMTGAQVSTRVVVLATRLGAGCLGGGVREWGSSADASNSSHPLEDPKGNQQNHQLSCQPTEVRKQTKWLSF